MGSDETHRISLDDGNYFILREKCNIDGNKSEKEGRSPRESKKFGMTGRGETMRFPQAGG